MVSSSSPDYFLTYDDVHTKAGLMHQRANIQFLIQEAYASGRIPIIPKMILSGHHNYSVERSSDLSKYFSWNKTKVFNRNSKVEEPFHYRLQSDFAATNSMPSACKVSANTSIASSRIQAEKIVIKVVEPSLSRSFHGLWSNMSKDAEQAINHNVQVAFSERVRQFSAEIVREIGGETGYAAVHIRRGDKLGETAAQTSPNAVAKYLEETVARSMPVYVLTDDSSVKYIKDIQKQYPVFHYRMFRNLRSMICKTPTTWGLQKAHLLQPDNFLLYAVEMCLLADASIPIYTFKTMFSPYHLCDVEGWV